jgi:hypothetical protein
MVDSWPSPYCLQDFTLSIIDCFNVTGACCFADESCEVMTQQACQAAGGVYMGNDVPCDPNPCITQPGDTCLDPWIIPSIPFNDTGYTCDYNNDYDEVCSYTGSTAPDVVYVYTPDVDVCVDITLCNGSDYDTKLYVYEDICPDSGNPFACNDDECPGYVSELTGLNLVGGSSYYIVVDGYSTACGNYIIDMYECPPPCELTCPEGSSIEAEACGDDTNGGCNMDVPAFEPIACGETVCGTIWAVDGSRDTDWYEVVTSEPMILTWTVEAEFDMVCGLVEMTNPGSGDCNDSTGYLNPYITAGDCEQVSIVTDCLPAGTHWIFVSHQTYYDWPCDSNNDYIATLTCEPCTPGPLMGGGMQDAWQQGKIRMSTSAVAPVSTKVLPPANAKARKVVVPRR